MRVGAPGAFGASVGGVNAFDGLRHLMELLVGDSEKKFEQMPYEKMRVLVEKLDRVVIHLNTSDPWSTETAEVRKLVSETQGNQVSLRDQAVVPLVALYNYYTDRGSNSRQQIADGHPGASAGRRKPTSCSGSRNGVPGNGILISSSVGAAGLHTIEARTTAAEAKNVALELEVNTSKHTQMPPPTAAFRMGFGNLAGPPMVRRAQGSVRCLPTLCLTCATWSGACSGWRRSRMVTPSQSASRPFGAPKSASSSSCSTVQEGFSIPTIMTWYHYFIGSSMRGQRCRRRTRWRTPPPYCSMRTSRRANIRRKLNN
jgi:hypothetical protein